MKCFLIDVRIYSIFALSSYFFYILAFCHADIEVCIYCTCAFLIVKWILMLIMYSAVSS